MISTQNASNFKSSPFHARIIMLKTRLSKYNVDVVGGVRRSGVFSVPSF